MKAVYQMWMQIPESETAITHDEFFRAYKWTRHNFFAEASRRGDDIIRGA